MKIAIMGAGTLGKSLANTFCNDKHDVLVIDTSSSILERLKDKLDVMTLCGNGATVETMKNASIGDMELFIAVSGNDTYNIHACRIAKHFGAKFTLCRLITEAYFDPESGFTLETAGIDHIVLPEEACVNKIFDVLDSCHTLEKIHFSHPDALVAACRVFSDSPAVKKSLKAFPEKDLINSIRFAAILRKGKMISPRGDTVLKENDEVYIAGHKDNVNPMLKWLAGTACNIKNIVIAGDSLIAVGLAEKLVKNSYNVRMIIKTSEQAEIFLDNSNCGIMVVVGDANDNDILEEAGVDACDAFIAVQDDDEDNILSCVIAKRMGAAKVITLTTKSEYSRILPSIRSIDCGFSKWLIAVNSVLCYFSSINKAHTNAILHGTDSYISEYEVQPQSAVCNKSIGECSFPASTVLSMIFRGDEVLAPSGNLKLQSGDLATLIIKPEDEHIIAGLFKGK
jgi:trk system potassium uptake protein TrkA